MLDVPVVDMALFAGDESNHKIPAVNFHECMDFLVWYSTLDIEYKVYVAGNHSTAIDCKMITRNMIEDLGLIYLEHESVEIEGIKIFGSPYTPRFGVGWGFNVNRDRLHDYWQEIPDDTSILITHGPPKGILDLSVNRDGYFEQTGCTALYKRVLELQCDYNIFGHIHDERGCNNAGMLKLNNCVTTFINASVVDLKHRLVNNGEIIDI
jgi:Icc-related predicted phosphoesterase